MKCNTRLENQTPCKLARGYLVCQIQSMGNMNSWYEKEGILR